MAATLIGKPAPTNLLMTMVQDLSDRTLTSARQRRLHPHFIQKRSHLHLMPKSDRTFTALSLFNFLAELDRLLVDGVLQFYQQHEY
jgi:hypothetical protein